MFVDCKGICDIPAEKEGDDPTRGSNEGAWQFVRGKGGDSLFFVLTALLFGGDRYDNQYAQSFM